MISTVGEIFWRNWEFNQSGRQWLSIERLFLLYSKQLGVFRFTSVVHVVVRKEKSNGAIIARIMFSVCRSIT
jgi:hypothetical protein